MEFRDLDIEVHLRRALCHQGLKQISLSLALWAVRINDEVFDMAWDQMDRQRVI